MPAKQLTCKCRVINEDDKPFDFTAALHSYFEVLNIGTIRA
jgi:glucose-6-phosphate 1-epimerase